MKTSIALTTYNGSKYIVELLESLKTQTQKPDEVIIVDDVSTDDTVEKVKSYIANNNFVNWKLIQNESNLGWKKNFRKAIKLCSGDVIFFCDQDDIWHHNKIEMMSKAFEDNPKIHVLISNYVLLTQENTHNKGQKGIEKNDGTIEQIQGWKKIGSISRPGCVQAFTRNIAEIMNKYDDEKCAHDHVVYNLGLVTNSLYILNKQLIDYRRHTDNASTYKIGFGKKRKSIEAEERVRLCKILLQYCKDLSDTESFRNVEIRENFYAGRKKIFSDGKLLDMMGFILLHFTQYASARDIIVDLIAMTKS